MIAKRLLPVMAASAVLLAACSTPPLPGSAAVVGDERLTDNALAQESQVLSEALGVPESPRVNQAIINQWIVTQLLDDLAARSFVDVTEGEVYKVIRRETKAAGGREAFEAGALQSGVLPEDIPDAIRTSLLVQKLSERTATPQDPTGQQGLVSLVQLVSGDLDPRVSPRYGTWDAQQLSVGDLPTDLSEPIAVEDPIRTLQ